MRRKINGACINNWWNRYVIKGIPLVIRKRLSCVDYCKECWTHAEANEKDGLSSNITPILIDYKDNDELQASVNSTISENGHIELVVAWIHSDAPEALKIIADEILDNSNEGELFHVLGSSSNLNAIKRRVIMPDSCLYYQIRLGFVIKGGQSRWLTNEEISDGVIKAIKNKNKIEPLVSLSLGRSVFKQL